MALKNSVLIGVKEEDGKNALVVYDYALKLIVKDESLSRC
jgi:hypothetical protein